VSAPAPAIVEEPIEPEAQIEDDDIQSERCRHIMVSGKFKGKPCGAPSKVNGLCNKHKPSGKQPVSQPVQKIEEPVVQLVPAVASRGEMKTKTPPKEYTPQLAPVEFVKLTSREEEKRIEFRVKTRDYILDHKVYPPVQTIKVQNYTVVEGTKVVLNDEKSVVLGFLNEKNELVRQPTPATDKVVLDYGIAFDVSHISDSDIDD
jgi:hypothetical protein